MRVLAASLVGILGLGALATMAACSDTSDGGSGGAGGSPAAAGSSSGGKANTAGGSSSNAGTGGSGVCAFYQPDCSACLGEKCAEQTSACTGSCGDSLLDTADCICNGDAAVDKCIGDFVTKEGDVAQKLAECFSLNCEAVCSGN